MTSTIKICRRRIILSTFHTNINKYVFIIHGILHCSTLQEDCDEVSPGLRSHSQAHRNTSRTYTILLHFSYTYYGTGATGLETRESSEYLHFSLFYFLIHFEIWNISYIYIFIWHTLIYNYYTARWKKKYKYKFGKSWQYICLLTILYIFVQPDLIPN